MALHHSSHLPATCGSKSASVSLAFAADGQTGIGDMSLAQWNLGVRPTLLRRVGSSSKGRRCPGQDWSRAKSGKSWSAVAVLPASSSFAASWTDSSNTWLTFAHPGAKSICLSELGAIGPTEPTGTRIACWNSCEFNSGIRGSSTSTPRVTPCCQELRTYRKKTCFHSSRLDTRNSPALPGAAT